VQICVYSVTYCKISGVAKGGVYPERHARRWKPFIREHNLRTEKNRVSKKWRPIFLHIFWAWIL